MEKGRILFFILVSDYLWPIHPDISIAQPPEDHHETFTIRAIAIAIACLLVCFWALPLSYEKQNFLGWSAPLTYPTAKPSLYCLLHDLPKSLYKNIIESLQ